MTIVASYIIYVLLGGLYCLTLHTITYRLLFVDRKLRPCDSDALHHWSLSQASDSHQRRRSKAKRKQSWLSECVGPFTTRENAAVKLDDLRLELDSHIGVLNLVATLSPTLGLLGTVLGFLAAKIDSTALGHAFATTALGIIVSIIPTVYLSLTQTARNRVQEQMELLARHIDRMQWQWQPGISNESHRKEEPISTSKDQVNVQPDSQPIPLEPAHA